MQKKNKIYLKNVFYIIQNNTQIHIKQNVRIIKHTNRKKIISEYVAIAQRF